MLIILPPQGILPHSKAPYSGKTYEYKFKVYLCVCWEFDSILHRIIPPAPPPRQEEIRCKRTNCKATRQNPLIRQGRKEVYPRSNRSFLVLARAVDGTMLTPLSAFASKQAIPTEATMEKCLQFLGYTASQKDTILTYKASNMVLATHINASYLSGPKARSQASGHMFMAEKEEILTNNGALLNILQIIRAVMSSAAEAELGTLFINAEMAVSMQRTLEELGHPHMLYSPIKSFQRRS